MICNQTAIGDTCTISKLVFINAAGTSKQASTVNTSWFTGHASIVIGVCIVLAAAALAA